MRSKIGTSGLALTLMACGGGSAGPKVVGASSSPGGVSLSTIPPRGTCLGFTAAGDGALFVTGASDRFAEDSEAASAADAKGTRITVGFAMHKDAPPPASFEEVQINESNAEKEWAAARPALEKAVTAAGLTGCIPGVVTESESGAKWVLNAGRRTLEFKLTWQFAKRAAGSGNDGSEIPPNVGTITMAHDGKSRALGRSITVDYGDGGNHEELKAIYANPAGSLVALVINNQDTGLDADHIELVKVDEP